MVVAHRQVPGEGWHLGDVVSTLLAHGVEPCEAEERLGPHHRAPLTDLLRAPRLVSPHEVLLQAGGGLGREDNIVEKIATVHGREPLLARTLVPTSYVTFRLLCSRMVENLVCTSAVSHRRNPALG